MEYESFESLRRINDRTPRPPRLFFSVGCQRSGKSTLARKWLWREEHLGFDDDGYPRYVWDTDNLRLVLHGKAYNRHAEPIAFAIKHYAIATALRGNSDVLVAGTHTTSTSIRRILEIRRDAIPVLVDTPLEVCLQRAIATRQEYLLDVIPRVHARTLDIKEYGIQNYMADILSDMKEKVKY